MSRRSGIAAVCLLTITAACAVPSESAGPSAQRSSAPQSSVPPSGQSSAAASGSSDVMELERSGDPLMAGRYTRSGFLPAITFEVDGGVWYAEQLYAGFFDIQQDVGSPDVIALQFARPSEIYSEEGSSLAVDTAEGAAAALRGNPNLTVIGDSESLIGGHEGIVVEVEHAGRSEANVSVMLVPPGPLGIDPGRRLWVAFLDTDDGVLAIMVGGSVARWDDALAAAEPVLESVTIGE